MGKKVVRHMTTDDQHYRFNVMFTLYDGTEHEYANPVARLSRTPAECIEQAQEDLNINDDEIESLVMWKEK